MLSNLKVANFALIEKASLDFNEGFTVITGETGSGKSILLGALALILGERANYSVIRNKDKKTIVEAEFRIKSYHLEDFFAANDLDYNHETIIRREINAEGRSRAFVNDSPVQLSILKELTSKLIHIHSQHNTLQLKNKDFQLEVLDDLCGNTALKKSYQTSFKSWQSIRKELQNLEEKKTNLLKEAEFNRFQLDEIQTLHLESTDYTSIEEELNLGESSEELKEGFQAIEEGIGENGVISQLEDIAQIVGKSGGKNSLLKELHERIKSVIIELKDITEEAVAGLDSVEIDPARLNEITLLMDRFYSISKKHNIDNQADLQQKELDLLNQVEGVDAIDSQLEKLQTQLEKEHKNVVASGEKLSAIRKKEAKTVVKNITVLLEDLKLPDTRLEFDIQQKENPDLNGLDQVNMLFTPNKGMPLTGIEKAASGGELSRLMLALQTLLSSKKQLPTLIFDEIDTGVSGEVAQRIGDLLRKLGQNIQLFAITHLPQVAGKGQSHLKVHKRNESDTTITQISTLSNEDRVVEIAKLMSGTEINQAALENAKALMN